VAQRFTALAAAFEWRSGSPLLPLPLVAQRSPLLPLPLGGAAVYRCDKQLVFNPGFSR
jgi:hypothetical protein